MKSSCCQSHHKVKWHQILQSDISYMSGAFWDKVIDFINEPVVQCDAPAVKNILLDDDDDNDVCLGSEHTFQHSDVLLSGAF